MTSGDESAFGAAYFGRLMYALGVFFDQLGSGTSDPFSFYLSFFRGLNDTWWAHLVGIVTTDIRNAVLTDVDRAHLFSGERDVGVDPRDCGKLAQSSFYGSTYFWEVVGEFGTRVFRVLFGRYNYFGFVF